VNSELRDDSFVQHLTDHLDRLAARDDTPDDEAAQGRREPVDQMDLDTASAVVAQLRVASTWIEPPADLRATVLARALAADDPQPLAEQPDPADLTQARPTEPAAAEPSAPDNVRPLVPRRRRQLRWTVPIAAVAAVAFTFSVLTIEHALEDQPAKGQTYLASGTSLAPEAGARVSVAAAAAGFSVVVDAHDLPAAAPGSYYIAWLSGPKGSVPIGSLHARKSRRPITMWSGVDPAAYPDFTMTLQQEGQPPTRSKLVVLKATLKRP
jgi:hypothetical protein